MNLFENYNTAKQKYGEKLVKCLSGMGIPSQYLLSACRFTAEGINPNDIKLYFRQWMTYVKRNDGGQYDVNQMSFDDFYQTIQSFKSKYGIPNKVYEDGIVSIGKITSPKDISKFPVKNDWCIKQPNQYRKYINNGWTFYLIDNGDESDYVRYVVLMVGIDGRKYYYDLDNNEMNARNITEFESHLTPESKEFINNLKNDDIYIEKNNQQNINENKNMKQTIRLTESELKEIVTDVVREVLKEGKVVNHVPWHLKRNYFIPEDPEITAKRDKRYREKFTPFEDMPINFRKSIILRMLKQLNIPVETWISMPKEKRDKIEDDYYQELDNRLEDEREMLNKQEREAEIAAQLDFSRRSGW